MTGVTAVRRLELGLVAALAGAVLVMLAVDVDAVRFHLPRVLRGEPLPLDAHTAAILVLLVAQAAVGWRALRSLSRQLSVQRRLRRLTVLEERTVAGHQVCVVGGTLPSAFCAGLWRARICVTAAAVDRLEPDELRAVVAHEAAHVGRRDPLRVAIAQLASDGLGFIRPLRRLVARQAAMADLAADAAAIRQLGSPGPLARAMLRIHEPSPERLEHLSGTSPRAPRAAVSVLTLTALAALGALTVALLMLPRDPTLPLLLLPALVIPALSALREPA